MLNANGKRIRLKKFRKSNVDLGKLILAVRAIAAEQPDRIYTKDGPYGVCLYRRTVQSDGTMRGCIIGEALRRSGWSTTGLDSSEMGGIQFILVDVFKLHSDNRQVVWLGRVQGEQDAGKTWANAVLAADKATPLA